ncbi:DUF397 domain-containing protein [Streptomyces sp. 6N223]|uniref:DUF397 domain-containing protein n=1 Tax=Streptomyces sp. 6N223 TaxID=3457412 RepID=UPI003FD3C782
MGAAGTSSDGGQCVAFSPSFAESGIVPVRDSKNPSGPPAARSQVSRARRLAPCDACRR